MILSSAPSSGTSLTICELGLTAIAIAASYAFPTLGSSWFRRIEQVFGALARRRNLAWGVVGLSDLALRLAILPFCPVPSPFDANDFSFLLAADTFAHGRLTNPTPAMWTHFESIHITMQPTYMSMYFPAQGLLLAAGKVLLGGPWLGVLCAAALMCAGICWMLQAWLPPSWALLGGFIAVLRLGLFSYWINSYSGGGSLAALGGALVLGALPRLMKAPRHRTAMLLAAGIALLALTRPFEGLLLCIPVSVVLGRWIYSGKNRPSPAMLFRLAAFPLAMLIAAGSWLAYYDYRAFGSPTTLPYTVDRATYAVVPYYLWQSTRPAPAYRYEVLRNFYTKYEVGDSAKLQTISGFFPATLKKIRDTLFFFAGLALLPLLFMLRRVLLDRRVRFLVLCVAILMAGMAIEIYLVPHYLAPFTAAIYALGLQAMRHLRHWRPEGNAAGLMLTRLMVLLCCVMTLLRLGEAPLHLVPRQWPPAQWIWSWYGPGDFGKDRAAIESSLEAQPGRQLVLVRYSQQHYPLNEWVYNSANIDDSQVIWARESDVKNDLELIRYYQDRKVWLVEPDSDPAKVSPYQLPAQIAVAAH
jgi:hypothetical protein